MLQTTITHQPACGGVKFRIRPEWPQEASAPQFSDSPRRGGKHGRVDGWLKTRVNITAMPTIPPHLWVFSEKSPCLASMKHLISVMRLPV